MLDGLLDVEFHGFLALALGSGRLSCTLFVQLMCPSLR